jgi:hypothetical protein
MNEQLNHDPEDARLKEMLKRAVKNEPAPPFLEARIRNTIRAERRTSWRLRLAPVAAAAAVCLGVTIAYQLGHLRLTTASQESYITAVSNRVATLMRVGLGDHIHCSVFRKFPKDPPSAEALAARLGPEYRDLLPLVRRNVPERYAMVIAHTCRYRGRRFVHLSLRGEGKLMSLVIARKKDGESFATEGMAAALSRSGIDVYRAGVQRFEIASFESRDHLVYFVSDLGRQPNMEMMLALAPRVREFLAAREL